MIFTGSNNRTFMDDTPQSSQTVLRLFVRFNIIVVFKREKVRLCETHGFEFYKTLLFTGLVTTYIMRRS